jgi:serine/threonine protein kinase
LNAPADLTAALADRHRLERERGQGGVATVYLAHDLRHDRQVAVKALRSELAAVIGADRFLSEIKTTAKLRHSHLLPLFDSGRTDFVFYVMRIIEGESLRDRLNRETSFLSPTPWGSRPKPPPHSTTLTATTSSIATSSPRTSCRVRIIRFTARPRSGRCRLPPSEWGSGDCFVGRFAASSQ